MASVAAPAENATDRDRLMKDVLAETPKALRGRLMNICVDSHPQNVAFIDWVIAVFILSKVGVVDLYDDDVDYRDWVDNHCLWSYEVDDDGRITTLIIGDEEGFDPFDLPAIIGRLARLTTLRLWYCRSLPAKELSNLPHLETVSLDECSDLLENFPAHMELKYLKKLWVGGSRVEPSSPFLTWMTGQLPSLETLGICAMEKNVTKCIVDALCTPDVCFQNSLKQLSIRGCKLDDNHFGTLLLEVLPRFPNLSHLDFSCNEIQSVQSIVDRINTDDTCFVSKSIRHLDLYGNSVIIFLKEDPKKKAAILSLLQTYNTICGIGCLVREEHDYGPDVEYALRINHAGRRIVEGNHDDATSLPRSVWPIALERVNEKSYRNDPFTGLYYLLRHGPVLQGVEETATTHTSNVLKRKRNDEDDEDV